MEIVPQLNNPAARMLRIVRRGKQVTGPNTPLDGWALVFDDNLQDHPWRVLRHIGQFLALPSEICIALEKVQGVRPAPYLWWSRQFMRCFQSSGLSDWNAFWKNINDDILSGIEVCSDTLSHQWPENTLVESTLADILVDVRALIDEVVDSAVDRPLKDFLLKHLDLVERAIEDYRFQGARPLEVAVDALVGTLSMHGDIYDKTSEAEVGKRFWKLMGRLAIVVGLATGVPQLPETIQKFLPCGEDAQDVAEPDEDSEISDVLDPAHGSGKEPAREEAAQ